MSMSLPPCRISCRGTRARGSGALAASCPSGGPTSRGVRDAVGGFLVRELGLQLKESPYINRTAHGMDFLGFRVRSDGLRTAREGLKRYCRKMRMCGMLFREGMLSENAYQDRITALTAPHFVEPQQQQQRLPRNKDARPFGASCIRRRDVVSLCHFNG